jgi:hypothetical protein
MAAGIISENHIKRLQELAGILSEDNSGKLKKFGINDDVANFIVGLDDKLAMFLANITISEFAKEEGILGKNLKEIIPIINQEDFLEFLDKNKERLNYVLEWLKSPFRQGDVNIKEIDDVSQAYEMADAWFKSLEATGVVKDESGDIVKTYMSDGMYWIDLKTNNSCEESAAMGHCGTDNRATTLLSLRDKNKSPYVTIGYNEDNKIITQVKGRQNKRPIDRYMKYVFDLLMEMVRNDRLVSFDWSYGTDLTPEEVQYVFEGNLNVYINGMLERNLKSDVYVPISFGREEITGAVGKEAYSGYVRKLLAKNLQSPSYRLKLKKGDIISAVGHEEYRSYLSELIGRAIENPNYKIGLPKADIISVVGEERYKEYIDGILNKVLENPVKYKIDMEKDELFALLGETRYKAFIGDIVRKIVGESKSENAINYLLGKHGIEITMEKIKELAGSRAWFMFLKRSHESGMSNIRAKLD